MDEELIDSIYAMQILAVTVDYYLLNLLFHFFFFSWCPWFSQLYMHKMSRI